MSPKAWLLEHGVHGDEVLSWVDDSHSGYAYPEAGGLLLRWIGPHERLMPVQDRLVHMIHDRTVGRAGHRYLFDTAVVLTGLEHWDTHEDPRWTAAREHLAVSLTRGEVVWPSLPPRWSTLAGPHVLKLAVGEAARNARGWSTPLLEVLERWPAQLAEGGRIVTAPHEATYIHAHAYAAEGLLALRELGVERTELAPAIAFLAEAQRDDGALPAWHDGRSASGPGRSDATAQAVRLFACFDPRGYANAIARGLDYLRRQTTAKGAVRYEDDSAHLNTWCTIFAAQARAWAEHGAGPAAELI